MCLGVRLATCTYYGCELSSFMICVVRCGSVQGNWDGEDGLVDLEAEFEWEKKEVGCLNWCACNWLLAVFEVFAFIRNVLCCGEDTM